MTERVELELTKLEFEELMGKINAARNTPLIAIHCGMSRSLQEAANAAWKALGEKRGWGPDDYMTIQPSTRSQRWFTILLSSPEGP